MLRRKRDAWDNVRWQALATYNAEVARGLVHTDEWHARMAKWQAAFDAEMGEKYAGKSGPMPTMPDTVLRYRR